MMMMMSASPGAELETGDRSEVPDQRSTMANFRRTDMVRAKLEEGIDQHYRTNG
jgi:hypothetical protein